MITDTHAHLYWDSFKDDLDEIIKRALEQGVTTIYNIGVDVETSQKALDQLDYLEKNGITAYSSIGIHPHEALRYAQGKHLEEDIKKLEAIYHQNPEKVKFVGECGLDFLDTDEPGKKMLVALFQAQIDLAKKLNLPLSIHCRDDRSKNPTNSECWDKVIEMTKGHFGIYHCYSGLLNTTYKILDTTKFKFSFAGNLTYPNNQYLRDAVKIIPEDRIVVETDCPFLPPQARRGQRNEPAFISETFGLIAKLKTEV